MQRSSREIAPDVRPRLKYDDRETLHVDFFIDHSLYSHYQTVRGDSAIIFLEKLLATDDEVMKCIENSKGDSLLLRGSTLEKLLNRSPLSLLVKRQKTGSRPRVHLEAPLMPFGQELFSHVINTLNLPASYPAARWSDSGSTSMTSEGIIIQTPFYDSGFWSLALCRRTSRMTTGALGFLEIDNGVDLDHVLLNVYRAQKELDFTYPFLLPLYLFEAHIRSSTNAFLTVFQEIKDIELKIRPNLEDKEVGGKLICDSKLRVLTTACLVPVRSTALQRFWFQSLEPSAR
ncbi:hypothetical protein GQ44DRAFT_763452 [Phaeosphaeriaceae sp. PMI808]|nr:hypothetical protein GQ44DRAFT_763452 [Phaeosphaeriaceae sp. PMI808]